MDNTTYRYAGLQQVSSPGLSVAQASERLRRFAYVEQRLMRLLASRVVSIPQRDIKALLARLQYEAASHANAWRNRVVEMRTNKSRLEGAPDAALEVLFDEAEHLPDPYPFLFAVTHLLKPALSAAYRAYEAATNELADYESVRIARQHLADEEQHLHLLNLVLADLEPNEEEQHAATEWKGKLTAYLAAAGNIDGSSPRTAARPREASLQPYHVPRTLTRDTSIPRVWDFVAPATDDTKSYLDYLLAIRISEINVSEGLAIVLCETHDRPWSFYLDIARHCWDEMRHSLFGEAGIEALYARRDALPMRDYEGVYVTEAPPLEQYAVLGLEVEGKNMKYPPGKRQEWEFARDTARQPLVTTFQDFDWADEVVHVNIARRQLDTWFEGGLKAISQFAKDGKEHRTEVKQRHSPIQIQPSPPSQT